MGRDEAQAEKCSFTVKHVEVLGHIMSAMVVATDRRKIKIIAESRISKSKK